MKQVFQLMLFLFLATQVNAQSNVARHSKDSIGNGFSVKEKLEVKWKFVMNVAALNQIAIKVSSAYSPKIIKATIMNSPNTLKVEYDYSLIQKEDILQVLKAEGIPDPYYIEKQNRYYLDNYGFITSDPVK